MSSGLILDLHMLECPLKTHEELAGVVTSVTWQHETGPQGWENYPIVPFEFCTMSGCKLNPNKRGLGLTMASRNDSTIAHHGRAGSQRSSGPLPHHAYEHTKISMVHIPSEWKIRDLGGNVTLLPVCRWSCQRAAKAPGNVYRKSRFSGGGCRWPGREGRQSPRILYGILGRPEAGDTGGNYWQHSPASK